MSERITGLSQSAHSQPLKYCFHIFIFFSSVSFSVSTFFYHFFHYFSHTFPFSRLFYISSIFQAELAASTAVFCHVSSQPGWIHGINSLNSIWILNVLFSYFLPHFFFPPFFTTFKLSTTKY